MNAPGELPGSGRVNPGPTCQIARDRGRYSLGLMGGDCRKGEQLLDRLVIERSELQAGREGIDPRPSRHSASSFTVATSWLAVWPSLGTGVTWRWVTPASRKAATRSAT
jgi:hypothetical protein